MKKTLKSNIQFLKNFSLLVLSTILLATLPFFIGDIVWQAPANVLGQNINHLHLRITLHFILSTVLLVIYLLESIKLNKKNILQNSKNLLLLFLLLSLFSAIRTYYTTATFSGLPYSFAIISGIKSFSFFINIVAFFIATHTILIAPKQTHNRLFTIILISISIQLLFSILQFLYRGPIAPNFFSWIGQPLFFSSHTYIGNHILQRAYGTTPHPNILGGIISFLLFLILSLKIKNTKKLLGIIFSTILIIFTLSRSALLACVIMIIIFLSRDYINKIKYLGKSAGYITFIAQLAIIISLKFLPSILSHGSFIISRSMIQNMYITLLTTYPSILFWGTGMYMSIPAILSKWGSLNVQFVYINRILAEPAHNIFLLILIEWGLVLGTLIIFGLGKIIALITKYLRPWQILAIISLINILGGVDHYLIY